APRASTRHPAGTRMPAKGTEESAT
ncbi:hypothetical protein GA0115258_119087, partial [Streptomyces sp. LamerLS-31b]